MCNSNIVPKQTLATISEMIADKAKISGILVVKSRRSGKDYTYKITGRKSRKYGYSLVASYEKAYMDFNGCAYKDVTNRVRLFPSFTNTSSEIVKGAQYVLNALVQGQIDKLTQQCEILHVGQCIKCNRPLTDADSIELGLGPVCRNY